MHACALGSCQFRTHEDALLDQQPRSCCYLRHPSPPLVASPMAKLTAKAYASDDDSDADMIVSPKMSTVAAKNGTNNKGRGASSVQEEDKKADGNEEDDSQGEDEEEYEIEAILEAKQGAFPEGVMGYLVKWKGYDATHNSWVKEEDAEGARELIAEFWKKNTKKQLRKPEPKPKPTPKPRKSVARKDESDDGEEEEAPKKKRGRPSKASVGRAASEDQEEEAPKKKPRKSTGAGKNTSASARRTAAAVADEDEDEDEQEFVNMKKMKDATTWDHLIQCIDTVEKADNGELYVYFTLKNGSHGKEKSDVCKKKMPYTLIEFYEGNLRWKPTSEFTMEE
ncbi:hypothetical protein C8Q80DRAFT_146850 [Daedaleopsis nitida]|nr:hypothetical protein C8Q80DRAFT_146850 [Daedaleopsis nitida]